MSTGHTPVISSLLGCFSTGSTVACFRCDPESRTPALTKSTRVIFGWANYMVVRSSHLRMTGERYEKKWEKRKQPRVFGQCILALCAGILTYALCCARWFGVGSVSPPFSSMGIQLMTIKQRTQKCKLPSTLSTWVGCLIAVRKHIRNLYLLGACAGLKCGRFSEGWRGGGSCYSLVGRYTTVTFVRTFAELPQQQSHWLQNARAYYPTAILTQLVVPSVLYSFLFRPHGGEPLMVRTG